MRTYAQTGFTQPTEVTGSNPGVKRQDSILFKLFRANNVFTVLQWLSAKDMLQLRITCQEGRKVIFRFMKDIIRRLPFLEKDLPLDFDFWQPALRFFLSEQLRLLPCDRLQTANVLAALKVCRSQGFAVSLDQMTAHTVCSFDKITPEVIHIANHDFPQKHTCTAKNRIEGPTQAYLDKLSLTKFLREIYIRADKSFEPDEICWINQPLASWLTIAAKEVDFRCLLFETFLIGLVEISKARRGVLQFRRVELLAHCSVLLRHRIWLQMTMTWGWEEGRERIRKMEQRPKAVEPVRKKWVIRLPPGVKQSKQIAIKKEEKKTSSSTTKDEVNIPPGKWPSLHLSICDHFSWDS